MLARAFARPASCTRHLTHASYRRLLWTHSSALRALPPAPAPAPSRAHSGAPHRTGHPSSARRLSSTPRRLSADGTLLDATPDPSRPDLFYHLTTAPSGAPRYALSFLPRLSAALAPDAPAVLGWLPAAAPGADGGDGDAGLNDFVENPAFRAALHDAVRTALDGGLDKDLTSAALATGEGWMHVHDERNPPPMGRIGEPDDIIGSVRVEGGQIVAGTYAPMPSYRLATADGVCTPTAGVAAVLRAALQADVDAAA